MKENLNQAMVDPKHIALYFINESTEGNINLDHIDKLCLLASDNDQNIAKSATAAIFSGIIEPLCDDFSNKGVELSNLVLTRILNFIRKTPGGAELDGLLNDFNFFSSKDIISRYQSMIKDRIFEKSKISSVKKIIILSRVTAGADIAITTVIVRRLARTFPKAKLVLIGPSHLSEITGIPNTKIINFIYKNDGSLLDKMTSWPRLLQLTNEEKKGFKPGEVLLFDPDTRMTQLGLLPLIEDENTYYFPSRRTVAEKLKDCNLSMLTNNWLNHVFSEDIKTSPFLFLEHGDGGHLSFCQKLKDNGCRFVITINFGVGNDPKKKISGQFEENLIRTLLDDKNTSIILDTGRGPQENQRAQYHLDRAKELGFATGFISESNMKNKSINFPHGLITFKGSLGSLGKLIDASDCFIGYDSCGQHLAAATATPAVIIFAGAPSKKFINRWTPSCQTSITIPVDAAEDDEKHEILLNKIIKAIDKIRRNHLANNR